MTKNLYTLLSPFDNSYEIHSVSDENESCWALESEKKRNEGDLDRLRSSSITHSVSESQKTLDKAWILHLWTPCRLRADSSVLRIPSKVNIPLSNFSSLKASLDQSFNNEIPNKCTFFKSLLSFLNNISCNCCSKAREVLLTLQNKHFAFSLFFWFFSSIFLTGINKYLFDTLKFQFPVLVTFIHFSLMSLFLKAGFTWFPGFPEALKVKLNDYISFVLPVAVFTAGDIAFTNKSYQFLSLSAITVLKSSIVVFTYLFSVCFGLESFRWILFFVLAFTMISISFAVPGLGTVNVFGIWIVMLAVIMAALRWVIIHFLLQKRRITSLQLLMLTQPLGSIFLAIAAVYFDYEFFSGSFLEDSDSSSKTAVSYLVIISVIFAFCLVLSEYQFVGATSSVTLCVAGIGKENLTILLSIVGFQEAVTARSSVAIGFSLVGVFLYSYIRWKSSLLDEEKLSRVLPQ